MTCPHCGFSKQIDQQQLPPDINKANCPKCKQSFPVPQPVQETVEVAAEGYQSSAVETEISTQAEIDVLPKAGFWIRLVAAIIDTLIVFVLQFLLGSLLALAGFATVGGGEGAVTNMAILIQLFGFVLSLTYYVFFTGYCGQTPGKMALRIKVIRCDGSSLGYGKAAFREIPAKFIAGIIFGIGYVMVAFDDQKQGLHDRMADTYVIKL
ncbi:MAG: zinc-ribbon domain-containing protein [Desulfuromusa sp.]|nr:zinc-ribbon domain-containing protein [Desulfuromusa sp.]